MTPRLRWSALALVAGLLGSGCSYRNAMWSAGRHAKDARQLEQRGLPSEARTQGAQAAAKARAWRTDAAVVLRAEGLAYSGAWGAAAEPIARARARVHDATLRERIDLADAECALAGGDPARAEATLAAPLASKNADRRSRAEYVAGRAAALRLDYGAAATHFMRSREPAAAGRGMGAPQQLVIARASRRSDVGPTATQRPRLVTAAGGAKK